MTLAKPLVIDNGEGIRCEVRENLSGSFYWIINRGLPAEATAGHAYFTREEAIDGAVVAILEKESEEVPQ